VRFPFPGIWFGEMRAIATLLTASGMKLCMTKVAAEQDVQVFSKTNSNLSDMIEFEYPASDSHHLCLSFWYFGRPPKSPPF
jgi:hypothetical protein